MVLEFNKSFASHPSFRLFVPELNPGINPAVLKQKSGQPVNCRCPACKHLFTISPHILKECRFCENQALCEDSNCSTCFEKSLASRHFKSIDVYILFQTILYKVSSIGISMSEWILYRILLVKAFTKDCARYDVFGNEPHDPRFVFKSTNAEHSFICGNLECNHTFPNRPCRVADLKYCPFCSPKNAKMLCPKGSQCKPCFKKSFASHPKSSCWDYGDGKNLGKTPYDVFISGAYLADFVCDVCNHTFQSKCNSVSSGFWCPYCASQKRCDLIDCNMCNSKKFSSHPSSIYWDFEKNPNILPSDISLGNGRDTIWMKCPSNSSTGHPSYPTVASHVARGSGCPSCLRKTEAKIGSFISSSSFISVFVGFTYIKEWKAQWLKNQQGNAYARFDFMLLIALIAHIALECDGLQHFIDGRWKSKVFTKTDNGESEDTRMRDLEKMRKAIAHNISGIRLFQPDVLSDKYDWKEWLMKAINIIIVSPTTIWVFPNNPIYQNHINLCIEYDVPYVILDCNGTTAESFTDSANTIVDTPTHPQSNTD